MNDWCLGIGHVGWSASSTKHPPSDCSSVHSTAALRLKAHLVLYLAIYRKYKGAVMLSQMASQDPAHVPENPPARIAWFRRRAVVVCRFERRSASDRNRNSHRMLPTDKMLVTGPACLHAHLCATC